jgi:hypothetical protein
MRRLGRWCFNIAAALSFLLFMLLAMYPEDSMGSTRQKYEASLWYIRVREICCACLPSIWLVHRLWQLPKRLRGRLAKVGFCRACGYDLTGNTSGTCPECGTAI